MKCSNKNFLRIFVKLLLCVFITSNITQINVHSYTQSKLTFGKDALKHISYLSKSPRISGTKSILNAQKYIKNEFQKYGYEVEEQSFNWPLTDPKCSSSKNIIASKKGLNNKQIIIGAHYDSVESNGADDNASGVAVLLEIAQKLNNVTLPYNIKFITFDAEELGLFGSRYFVRNMTQEDKSNTILYINIDSILGGDDLYIYGDSGARGWFRDEVLHQAKVCNIDIKTSPGLNPKDKNCLYIPEGECFDYSDHVYFRHEGIPFAYFESTSWDKVNEYTGYPKYRNKDLGMILHSDDDNLEYILNKLGDKAKNNLSACTSLIYNVLTNNDKQITIISNVNNNDLPKIKYELYHNNKLVKILSHENSNKITLSNLPKGNYKVKQINNTPSKIKCNLDNKLFKINDNGSMYLLYEDVTLTPKPKDYDGILIHIYGEKFDDPDTYLDDIYKEFIKIKKLNPKVIYNKEFSLEKMKSAIKEHNKNKPTGDSEVIPTFVSFSSTHEYPKLNIKQITKVLTSILITIFCSNMYTQQKGKLL